MKAESSFKEGDSAALCPTPLSFCPVKEDPRTRTPACGLSAQLCKLPLVLWPRAPGDLENLSEWGLLIAPFHGEISVPAHVSAELGNACLGWHFVLPCPLSCLRKCRFEFHNDTSVLWLLNSYIPFMCKRHVSPRSKKGEVHFCSSHGFSSLQKNIHNSQGNTFLTKW